MKSTNLPAHWVLKGDTYYFLVPARRKSFFDNKHRIRLGTTIPEAITTHMTIDPTVLDNQKTKNTNVWLTLWIGDHMMNSKRVRPATMRHHLSSIERIRPVFGCYDVDKIKSSMISRYYYRRFDENKTGARKEHETLSSFLTWCKRFDLILHNPATGLRLPRPQPRTHYVDDFEVDLFLETANPMIKKYIPLKIYTGARKNDLLAIKISHITDRGLYIGDRKSFRALTGARSRGRLFEIGSELENILSVFDMNGEYLFESSKGEPYVNFTNDTIYGFDSSWRRSRDKALNNGMAQSYDPDKPNYVEFEEAKMIGIPLIFQERDLRAKTATDSESLLEASLKLGHTNLATTLKTYRRKPEFIRAPNRG